MSKPNFGIDSLVHSVKEVQQEKVCLEQKLNEQRSKRRILESSLEATTSKLMQTSDIHLKMEENVKMAQHKVIQTQSRADSLEQANQIRRKRIADLNHEIESEKQKQMEEVKKFEEDLSFTAGELNKAKHYYTDPSLDKEIESANETRLNLTSTAMECSQQIESMNKLLDNLKLKETEEEAENDMLISERQNTWDIFKKENLLATDQLDRCSEELQNVLELLCSSKQ